MKFYRAVSLLKGVRFKSVKGIADVAFKTIIDSEILNSTSERAKLRSPKLTNSTLVPPPAASATFHIHRFATAKFPASDTTARPLRKTTHCLGTLSSSILLSDLS